MLIRRNQADLTTAQRRDFTDAVLALKRRGEYDTFVRIHRDVMSADADAGPRVAHRTPSFLAWHRQFLLLFERALQQVNATVTLPYWDWTVARHPTSSPWTAQFLGGNGQATTGQVLDGPFAYSTGAWTLNVRSDTRPYLRRQLGVGTSLPTVSELRAVMGLIPYDSPPYNSASATGFRNHLEGWRGANLHNRVHNWVGGTMSTGDSPNDPCFWLHHCFLDKLWADWQATHPTQSYLPSSPTVHVIALNDRMPPWLTMRPRDVLDHRLFYRYA